MTKQIVAEMDKKMKKAIDGFRGELASIRTGRASSSMLDSIKVEYYGSMVSLNQVGNMVIPEPRTIEIKPWDLNALAEIEKAILKSDLGITPYNDGKVIRITFPKLTEERRKELVKNVKKTAENFRITVRNERRDAIELIKKSEKDKAISKDEELSSEHEIQKMTDTFIKSIDDILSHKEKEIMEV